MTIAHTDKIKKETGSHYTPSDLSRFVARQIVKAWAEESIDTQINVLDPAVGDGELLLSLLSELSNHDYSEIEVFGFDTNPQAIDIAAGRIYHSFPDTPIELKQEDFLSFTLENYGLDGTPNLFSYAHKHFDIIIANPPYVRTQVMGSSRTKLLANQFGLSGRVDLYHAFIQAISRVLRPGGIVGIIVSNRFMSTKAGADVRRGVLENFDILHIWDLGDTKLFEAAVLPSVLLMKRKNGGNDNSKPKFTSIYSTLQEKPSGNCENIFNALTKEGVLQLGNGNLYHVKQGELDHGGELSGVWHITNEYIDRWLASVNKHTYLTFRDIGNIRVGVKTNADKIFIRSDWDELPEEEIPELLRPVTTHYIARRYKPFIEEKRKILYPHQCINGKRVAADLTQYPKTWKYLSKYKPILTNREYLQKSGREWYEIWVPQDPSRWDEPKVVFRDITDKSTFWMDHSGSIVNGDCYWIACDQPKNDELLWLALAVGNSSFIEQFYDNLFNNRLYAGRRRFITQYVEKFPLPNPNTKLAKRIISLAKKIYELIPSQQTEELEKKLNELVWSAFGLGTEKIPG